MSGIYKIINLINNKSYIGSSKNCNHRKASHLYSLRKNKHINFYLQRSFNKYGESNFKFEIIEKCKEKDLIIREQYWIDNLSPEYNIRQFCQNNLGFTHSELTRKKISDSSKILWKNHKQKMIDSLCKPVLSYDKNGNFIKEYKSVKEAAKDLNIAGTNVSAVLKGKSIFIKGIHFIYKSNFINNTIKIRKKKNNSGKCNQEKVELWLGDKLLDVFNSKKELAFHINVSNSIIGMIISKQYFKKHPKTKMPNYTIKEILKQKNVI